MAFPAADGRSDIFGTSPQRQQLSVTNSTVRSCCKAAKGEGQVKAKVKIAEAVAFPRAQY
jgi:hypothetical protein